MLHSSLLLGYSVALKPLLTVGWSYRKHTIRFIVLGVPTLRSSISCLTATYAVRPRGGWTRSYSACRTEIRAWMRILLRIPCFFTEHAQPSVAHLGTKGLDLLSIQITTNAPVLRVLSRLCLQDLGLISQRLDWWQPWNCRSIDTRRIGLCL